MRRVVVTPTFAAGLGVVVAAFLAYPTQTVFSYAAPGGAQCKVLSCGYPSQAGGEPATGPSQQLGTPGQSASPGVTGGTGGSTSSSSPTSSSSAGGGAHTLDGAPNLNYWTSRQGERSFGGKITITFGPGATPAHWRLRFGYPAARILRVRASKYLYLHHGAHTAVVASGTWPKQAPPGKPINVTIGVTGHPGPPGKCTFNGEACHIVQHNDSDTAGSKSTAGSKGH
jgi:hypothetical protein